MRVNSPIGPLMQQLLAHTVHNAESIRIRLAIVEASEKDHPVTDLLAEMQSHFRVHNPEIAPSRHAVEESLCP